MMHEWWDPAAWAERRKRRPSGRGSARARSRVPRLESLEERIALDATSAGINGINAIGLLNHAGTILTGAGVLIG